MATRFRATVAEVHAREFRRQATVVGDGSAGCVDDKTIPVKKLGQSLPWCLARSGAHFIRCNFSRIVRSRCKRTCNACFGSATTRASRLVDACTAEAARGLQLGLQADPRLPTGQEKRYLAVNLEAKGFNNQRQDIESRLRSSCSPTRSLITQPALGDHHSARHGGGPQPHLPYASLFPEVASAPHWPADI